MCRVLIVKLVTSTLPKNTSVAVSELLPVRFTVVPPAVEPLGGATVVNVGVGVTYVYGWPPDVPLGFLTVTLTPPAACAGDCTVIDVSLWIVKLVTSTLPKNTSVAVSKLLPVRFTAVPPAVEPLGGATVVNVGAGGVAGFTVRTSADEVPDVPPGVITWTS